jgi:hypothetical protein
MMLNVFAYHLRRHLVAYRPGEVSVFPQFPSPQPMLHLWVLSKYRSRTQTLEPTHYLRNRVSRWERAEDMYMICAYFHLFYRDVVLLGYLLKHLADATGNRPLQDVLAILGRPHQMVSRIISGVCCSSKDHKRILANSHHLGIGYRTLAEMVHPSPPQAAGHLEPFS